MENNEDVVIGLDIGTTTIVCQVINTKLKVLGEAKDRLIIHRPQLGHVEVNPDELWESVVRVLREAVKESNVPPNKIKCIGLSTQRNTFVTWDKTTGKYFHNFITWMDYRATDLINKLNASIVAKLFRSSSSLLYFFSRQSRYLAASTLTFNTDQVTIRLKWVCDNIPELKLAAENENAMYGCIDTWLLYMLTNKKVHVQDYSNASASGMFDPYKLSWITWGMKMLGIPTNILPEVVDTARDFGFLDESIIGASIPITCCMADQAASMWGSCCFKPGDAKITMGTGTFMNINTGNKIHSSISGLYPIIAWKLGPEICYSAEGASSNTGTSVDWAIKAGLISDPFESANLADEVNDCDGVFFIPGFSGLGAPINDKKATAGFIGMKLSTQKQHLVRSVLEAIVFRAVQLYKCTQKETDYKMTKIRIDGGVSYNNFISQLFSDMTNLKVERSTSKQISALGCALLAGYYCDVWKSKEEIANLYTVDQSFIPREDRGSAYLDTIKQWETALNRFIEVSQTNEKSFLTQVESVVGS